LDPDALGPRASGRARDEQRGGGTHAGSVVPGGVWVTLLGQLSLLQTVSTISIGYRAAMG
jgi:hypothetical protein